MNEIRSDLLSTEIDFTSILKNYITDNGIDAGKKKAFKVLSFGQKYNDFINSSFCRISFYI